MEKEIQIVLERCSRTEAALSAMKMKKKVIKCDICGCSILNDKTESAEDKLSPLQFDLLVTIMGSVEESRRRVEDIVPSNSSACPNCISRFQTLELLYAEICTLQNRVDDILAQILKIIQDRLKLVHSTKEVEDPFTSKADSASINVLPLGSSSLCCVKVDDKEEVDPTTSTTTDCINTGFTLDEEEDDVMNIKEEMDLDDDLEPLQQDEPLQSKVDHLDPEPLELGDDPLHHDVDPPDPESNPTDNSSRQRQCKIRARQVISSMREKDLTTMKPTNDNSTNHCDNDENYSSNNDSDTDMDSSPSDTDMDSSLSESEQSLLGDRNYVKRKRVRSRPVTKHKELSMCEVCGKHVKDLSMHMETHKDRSERQTFPCQKCSKTFTGKGSLYKHKKYYHDKIRSIKCRQCGKEFSDKRHLKSHMKSKHNPDPELAKKRRFICSICGQGYPSKLNLRHHKLYVHMKEHRIKCTHPTCKNTFSTDSALQHHLQHYHPVDDENKTICTICNENFPSVHKKVVHIRRVHEKAFNCKFCDKSYAAKMFLDNHERTHTGDQPYLCTRCGKTFTNENTLSVHQQVTCNTDTTEADKIRKARSKRQMEWRAKKKNSQHKCDFCLKTFLLKERLLLHISKVHKDETELDQDDEESC